MGLMVVINGLFLFILLCFIIFPSSLFLTKAFFSFIHSSNILSSSYTWMLVQNYGYNVHFELWSERDKS